MFFVAGLIIAAGVFITDKVLTYREKKADIQAAREFCKDNPDLIIVPAVPMKVYASDFQKQVVETSSFMGTPMPVEVWVDEAFDALVTTAIFKKLPKDTLEELRQVLQVPTA